MRNQKFEFRVFPADEFGGMDSKDEFTVFEEWRDTTAAKGRAGRLAKKNNGPVDVAFANEPGERAPWNERYITTASPSEYNRAGFRFERLDN